jgi:predicted O-methyltransferase YrrM
MHADGVEWLGKLDKTRLHQEIARAELMIYPGVPDFAETGCIAATEAQACGTPLVATRIGAIPETLHPDAGRLIDGDSTTEDYQTRFADTALGLMADRGAYDRCVEWGRTWAEHYDLTRVAAEWETYVYDYFDARYEARKPAILRQLLWHEDHRAANVVASSLPLPTVIELYKRHPWGGRETPEGYARHALPPVAEAARMDRGPLLTAALMTAWTDERDKPIRILDFAGGNGVYAEYWLETFPQAVVDLVDYSSDLCKSAQEYLTFRGYADRVTVTVGSLDDIPRSDYDLVFAGEIAEHFLEPEAFLTALERHARTGGLILITVPQGPFGGLMHRASLDWSQHVRGHKVAFDGRDIEEMVGHKPGYNQLHAPAATSGRNESCGHYVIWWCASDDPVRLRDDVRKAHRTRPYESLAVCMIVRDAEPDVVRALQSIDWIADEVWIADTGSRDRTIEFCQPFVRNGGAVWTIGTCPDAPPGLPPPGDFGWARNQSISRTEADWILWLDADETLIAAGMLRDYMTDNAFNGYVLRQCHLTMDALSEDMIESGRPFRHDKPVRLFRRYPVGKQAGVTPCCYAVIHEHFQHGLNELIDPALEVGNVEIAHTGYLTEGVRRAKEQRRNEHLLAYDLVKYPERRLSRLIVARTATNHAKWEVNAKREAGVSPMAVETRPELIAALETLRKSYFDPADVYWDAVYPVYRDCLAFLGWGRDYGVFVVKPDGRMDAKVMRFLCDDDYDLVVDHYKRRLREIKTLPPITWGASTGAAVVVGQAVVGATPTHDMGDVTAVGELTQTVAPQTVAPKTED